MTERPRYHHDAEHGETRPPRDDRPDPHASLNERVVDVEREGEIDRLAQHGTNADVAGMGRAETSDRGGEGDPELPRGSRGDREERNPAQSTPHGVVDAEREVLRAVEEHTGVPLAEGEEQA
jgi:hypothetical protein